MPVSDRAPSRGSATLNQSEPVPLSSLFDAVQNLRPPNCPTDSVPPRLFREAFDSVGAGVLLQINTSLSAGCVPTDPASAGMDMLSQFEQSQVTDRSLTNQLQ